MSPAPLRREEGMKRVFVLSSIVILVLTSCIGIESSIEVSDDGSGRLELRYTVSRAVRNVGRAGEDDTILPLPIEREAFEEIVARDDGLSLESYERRDDEEELTVSATVAFQEPSDLNTLFGEETVRYFQEDGTTVLQLAIYEGSDEPPDPEALDLLRTFFADYELRFQVTAPSQIQEVSTGSIGDDSRFAQVAYALHEILPQQQPVVWEIRW
jgi:hypothetical protein